MSSGSFDSLFGGGRHTAHRSVTACPAPGTVGGALLLCSGCHNSPELADGWRGHDEDCPRLGAGPDVTATVCTDCEAEPVWSGSEWSGHLPGCSQMSSPPDGAC